jgi:hypothetical protein
MVRTSLVAAVILVGCWVMSAVAEDVAAGNLKISSA